VRQKDNPFQKVGIVFLRLSGAAILIKRTMRYFIKQATGIMQGIYSIPFVILADFFSFRKVGQRKDSVL
jgi:hypothetical protein